MMERMEREPAALYLVPTPIGNLEDISLRAIRILGEVDVILAEDTRVTAKLLKHYDINTPMRSFHQNNEHKILDDVLKDIRSGIKHALVSDAGTPGISDPGFLLARRCLEEGIDFESLPGATAFVPALIKSGMAAHSFVFEGFLPAKKGRQKRLSRLVGEDRTIILYESPYKLLKLLQELSTLLGQDRTVSISRELTKLHEETLKGTLAQLKQHFKTTAPRGEFVIVVEGAQV